MQLLVALWPLLVAGKGETRNASVMKRVFIFLFFFCVGLVCPASKYYDGPIRPYEFGYSIDKNQHRFEKKGKLEKEEEDVTTN